MNRIVLSSAEDSTDIGGAETYVLKVLPTDIAYPELLREFKQFCIAVGYTPETVGPVDDDDYIYNEIVDAREDDNDDDAAGSAGCDEPPMPDTTD